MFWLHRATEMAMGAEAASTALVTCTIILGIAAEKANPHKIELSASMASCRLRQ
jgi:hypothetical protein